MEEERSSILWLTGIRTLSPRPSFSYSSPIADIRSIS
jgi:hypothetical protein